MNPRSLLAAALLCAASVFPAQAQVPRVVDLPTRDGVTERLLVLPTGEARASVVLLTGGAGTVGIAPDGRIAYGGNFLVRSRALFAQQGLAVVVVDLPSDRADLNGDFRESPQHMQDLGAAVRWTRAQFGKPVYLVGTSRGTQSAAAAGLALQGDAAPDGLVLTSTVLARSGPRAPVTARPVNEMELGRLAMPVLVLHHAQDPCSVCSPAALPGLMAKLPPATSTLVTLSGGQSTGAPCEAFSYHGFNGIEERAVGEIGAWIKAR